jgi:hypothetical protein
MCSLWSWRSDAHTPLTLTQRSLNDTNFILHLAPFRFNSSDAKRVRKLRMEKTASRFGRQRQTHTTEYAVFGSPKEGVWLGGGRVKSSPRKNSMVRNVTRPQRLWFHFGSNILRPAERPWCTQVEGFLSNRTQGWELDVSGSWLRPLVSGNSWGIPWLAD